MKLNEALSITLKCYEYGKKPFYKAKQAHTEANKVVRKCCNKDGVILKTKLGDALELYSFRSEFSRNEKVREYSKSVMRYFRAVVSRL